MIPCDKNEKQLLIPKTAKQDRKTFLNKLIDFSRDGQKEF